MKRLIYVLIAMILVSCAPTPTQTPVIPHKTAVPTVEPKDCVDVISDDNEVDYGYLTISGTVKNNCSRTVQYIKIRVVLYDKGDNQVATDWSYAESDMMPSGAESPFDVIMTMPDNADTYKVFVSDFD